MSVIVWSGTAESIGLRDAMQEIGRRKRDLPRVVVDGVPRGWELADDDPVLALLDQASEPYRERRAERELERRGAWEKREAELSKREREWGDAIRQNFPRCPDDVVHAVSRLKGYLEPHRAEIREALTQHVRHNMTDYDDLLIKVGYEAARDQVRQQVGSMVASWDKP